MRLLLPEKLLAVHEEAVAAFNAFKRVVDDFQHDDPARTKKRDAFSRVENVKQRLETGLREFLRTEKLLEWKSEF
jgi:hypothetical protein